MNLNEESSLYEILGVNPSGSDQEIREAYLRIKSTYDSKNLALYTLISPDEREEALKKIESAYATLSNPEQRKLYNDEFYQNIDPHKLVSMDQSPPMENLENGEHILIPPRTDFVDPAQRSCFSPPSPVTPAATALRAIQRKEFHSNSSTAEYPTRPFKTTTKNTQGWPEIETTLAHSIEMETEWTGSFLKRIREAHQLSIEEMAGITKVTKAYLLAIEEENFQKLPATVYTRGFVIQIARALKLPHEKVATAYISRYHRAQTE